MVDTPLINCEVSLALTWSKNCVLTDIKTTAAQGDNPAIAAPKGATFEIKDTKLHVPVVTLSAENDNKLISLEDLKKMKVQHFKMKKIEIPKVEIKVFHVLIDGKPFFEIPVKNKKKPVNKLLK